MRRIATCLALVSALLVLSGGRALASPRVGVVVLGAEGLTEDQADEVAYDVAAAVAQRIEGDAIAGPTVRGLLPDGVPPGCEDQAVCGRRVAAELKTDEVLFLVVKRAGKRDLDLTFHRIARDPERIPTDQTVRLVGGLKAKREKPLGDAAAALYAPGSVVPWVEPAPPPPPPPDPAVVKEQERRARAEREARESVTHRKWFWPVVIGGAVVVVGGVVALTVWETRPGPTGTPITLP